MRLAILFAVMVFFVAFLLAFFAAMFLIAKVFSLPTPLATERCSIGFVFRVLTHISGLVLFCAFFLPVRSRAAVGLSACRPYEQQGEYCGNKALLCHS